MGASRFAFLVALGMAVLAPASAEAKLEFNLPAQVYLQSDDSGRSAADPNRCTVVAFAEFPKIKSAKGYELNIRLNTTGQFSQRLAPPFQTDGFVARYPPPAGFARFYLSLYSTGQGCANAIANIDRKWSIASAKVSLDKAFEKRFRKIDQGPLVCAVVPGSGTVKLGGWGGDGRRIIVRKQGTVTTMEEDSNQSINVLTNRYAGTGTTVTTGRESVVKIGALGGQSVLVGPNTTIRLTDEGFDVVKQPRRPVRWKIKNRPDGDYKVRTCNAVLSARG